MNRSHGVVLVLLALGAAGCNSSLTGDSAQANSPRSSSMESAMNQDQETGAEQDDRLQTATFGGGCFWCTEAVFESLRGVESVVSGYSGGHVPDPDYREVCTGRTGHAEVIQVRYDPEQVSYDDLLEVFWKTHDPTTLNRQGADVGTQYRSVVFYHDDRQRELAEHYKRELDESGAFNDRIVTEISEFEQFYPAEDYHQDYFRQNPGQGYCQVVIVPKLEKFRDAFADRLKDDR